MTTASDILGYVVSGALGTLFGRWLPSREQRMGVAARAEATVKAKQEQTGRHALDLLGDAHARADRANETLVSELRRELRKRDERIDDLQRELDQALESIKALSNSVDQLMEERARRASEHPRTSF